MSIILLLSIKGFSQNNAKIDSLKRELKAAEEIKKNADKNVSDINSQINDLLPKVYLTKGGFAALNFNQMSFTNWAAGGTNAISTTALGNFFLNYNKGKISWNNILDLAFGMIKNNSQELRKNEDKIDFLTKFGHNSPLKNLNYAVLGNFKSQFAPSYNFDANNVRSPKISDFLAPAFVLASVGIDYKPIKPLSVYFSPATGKFTIVAENNVPIKKSFNVDTSKSVRQEFGALMNVLFQNDIYKNTNLYTALSLFNNYTDQNTPNRKNIDINLQILINTKLNKFISASFFINSIYDNDIKIKYDKNDESKVGPRLQLKEVFGAGISINLFK
ncbi:MAG: DUF3078 domain-containing protein [Bacteroidetes bacterium]|nr:DUF3078 domain-containing protein [Bacteroidota bacterium]